jgi:ribosomal protein L15
LKLPKKRGWKNIKLEKNVFEVNLEKINEKFNEGEIVSAETLKEKRNFENSKKLEKISNKNFGSWKFDQTINF